MSKMTSSLSATMIGHGKSDHERHEVVKQHFRQESNSILRKLETHHPSHRHKIMQVQYPETIKRLCGADGSSGQGVGRRTQPSAQTTELRPAQTKKVMKESEFKEFHAKKLSSEYGMNSKKLRYNRSNASQAVVSNIMTGQGPNVVDPVFPHKATHYQCLALTNKLSMPDASVMPPDVAKPRKWLGDDKGWE